MKPYILTLIKGQLLSYLKKLYPDFKISEKNIIKCPLNCSEKETAQILKNELFCLNPECKFKGDIFSLIRKTKSAELTDEDIVDYLCHILDFKIEDNTEEILKKYFDAGFYLLPLIPNTKVPIKDFEFKTQSVHNLDVWNSWLDRGYGLALYLGKQSNVVAIDIDSDTTYEKVKHLFNETLIQTTKRGRHFLYNYDKDFELINHDNLRDKGYDMELRANNAYIVIAPTSVEGEKREWNNKKITDIPLELKKFLLENINKEEIKKDYDDKIQEDIKNNNLGNKLTGLDGNCNDTFVKLGGILRKKLNIEHTEYALSLFNNLLAHPMHPRQIRAMVESLNKYQTYDKQILASQVLSRLEIIKEGSAFQISKSLNQEQKDIEDVLNYLEKEGRIIDIGKNRYKIIEQIEWTTGYDDLSVPLSYEVPYFGKYAYFDEGNMILIGGVSGTGKTHVSANLIKKFYDLKQIPSIDLINTEAGSKIGKILQSLQVPFDFVHSPKKIFKYTQEIKLRDRRVTIIDWVKPKDADYAKTDNTFEYLHNELKLHGGLLIVFVQMRNGYVANNNKWVEPEFFAKDQISAYSAFTMKFLYPEGKDNLNPYGQTVKIRDSKTGLQFLTIPFKYDQKTKVLNVVDK